MRSHLDLSAFGTCGFVPESSQSCRVSERGTEAKTCGDRTTEASGSRAEQAVRVYGVAPGQGEKEGKRNSDESDPVP